MSGLEVLGIAASAVQVAQVSLAIVTCLTSLFHQVRDAPKTVQTRLFHVQTLFEISRLIASVPQLQTAEVDSVLRSCARDAEELREILRGLLDENDKSKMKKWTNAFRGIMSEKNVIDLLQSLEVGKTSLALCVAQIDSYGPNCCGQIG